MAGHGGESRNAHFADAAARISEKMASGSGYSDGTDGNASIDYHERVGRPYNGMMDEPDIPRFGADEIDYGY
jgi:hypothetical protein